MTRRLVATYLLLAAVVLVALEVPLGVVNQRGQIQEFERRVERDAVALAALSEDVLQAGATPGDASLRGIATSYGDSSGARVVMVDAAGRLVADSDTARPLGRSFSSRPEIAEALVGGVAIGTRRSQTLGDRLLYVAVPVSSGGTVHGAVRVTIPMSRVDAQIRRYWLALGGIALVVLIAVAIAGRALAQWVSRPLTRLRDTARQAGAGDLAARADVTHGPAEVRELAQDFDEMVARLERLVSAQEEFVADASHQLRSPLTALRLRLENLTEEAATPDEVEAAINEVDRLSRLVDGLLALARLDRGRATRTRVDVASVVAERAAAWGPAAAEVGVRIVAQTAGAVEAELGSGSLDQVLDNLITNALDASPPGETVTLGVGRERSRIEIVVEDRGPGMTGEQRRRAFERFASWRDSGGTGLGLAIVRRLVETDEGDVSLEPVVPHGLRVRISLPPAAGPRPAPATDRGAAHAR